MTRRGWLLFAVVALVNGVSYVFIRIAVEAEVSPVVVVWLRTAVAALVLVPVALKRGALRGLTRRWRGVAVLTLAQVTGPFLLITYGEQHISSSLAGLLVATEPILVVLLVAALGLLRRDSARERIGRARAVGLVMGLGGVAALLGVDVGGSGPQLFGAVLVLLAAALYAVAALLIQREIGDGDPIGMIAAIVVINTVLLTPVALTALPDRLPDASAAASIVALGVLCTAVAFLAYFALLAEAGPSRGAVVFFVTPVVTVAAGALALDEAVTAATLLGLLLIIAGSRLATGGVPGRAP